MTKKKIVLGVLLLLISCISLYATSRIWKPDELLARMHRWVTDEIMKEFLADYSQYELKIKGRIGNSMIYELSFNHNLINNEVFLEIIKTDERVDMAQLVTAPASEHSYAYPNPVRSGNVTFVASYIMSVVPNVKIYNTKGQLVRALPNHSREWDLRDEYGRIVPSGIYFYQITPDGSVRGQKGKFVVLTK